MRALLRRFACCLDVRLTLLTDGLPMLAKTALAETLGSRNFSVRRAVPPDYDVVWHPWNGTFYRSDLPAVVTIHDAVPFRFPASDARARDHQQAPFRRSARTATRVIAVSRFGAREITETLAVPMERIEVIYHGVEESFCTGPLLQLPAKLRAGRYFLFIGDHREARKNFATLAAAFARTSPQLVGVSLAAISNTNPHMEGVIHIPHLTDDVRSHVDERLRALYRGALAVCVPSYHETFGMPMVEAMACGVPVLASRASCLPEIGGDAVLFVEPHDVDEWAIALLRIAREPALREALSQKGPLQARRYRWDHCAAQTLAVLRSACSYA